MLNDQSFVEDTKRTGSPDEPKDMPEPRFSKMPDTSQEKQEVVSKCLGRGYKEFMTLLGDNADIQFMVQLQINLPRYSDKQPSQYSLEQAEVCITFARQMNKMLEKCVDAMDLGDINDLFLGDDQ